MQSREPKDAIGGVYVGSATNADGTWSHWSSYASTGHGHNKGLMQMMSENGAE